MIKFSTPILGTWRDLAVASVSEHGRTLEGMQKSVGGHVIDNFTWLWTSDGAGQGARVPGCVFPLPMTLSFSINI